jgi:hypothetical protein
VKAKEIQEALLQPVQEKTQVQEKPQTAERTEHHFNVFPFPAVNESPRERKQA